jgi:hypothetical protein
MDVTGSLIIEDRDMPGIIQFLAGGTFNIADLDSQIVSTDGSVQVVSSTAGTTYTASLAVITSVANLWPRDWDASGGAALPVGDLTNKDLGGNTGWTLINPGFVRLISEDPGQDLLASGGVGPITFCWLVDTTLVGLTAQAAAFAAGANNWHRKTNLPFAMLDNLEIGTTYLIALGMVDDRNRREAPNIGAGDYVSEVVIAPERGGGGGARTIMVTTGMTMQG